MPDQYPAILTAPRGTVQDFGGMHSSRSHPISPEFYGRRDYISYHTQMALYVAQTNKTVHIFFGSTPSPSNLPNTTLRSRRLILLLGFRHVLANQPRRLHQTAPPAVSPSSDSVSPEERVALILQPAPEPAQTPQSPAPRLITAHYLTTSFPPPPFRPGLAPAP